MGWRIVTFFVLLSETMAFGHWEHTNLSKMIPGKPSNCIFAEMYTEMINPPTNESIHDIAGLLTTLVTDLNSGHAGNSG